MHTHQCLAFAHFTSYTHAPAFGAAHTRLFGSNAVSCAPRLCPTGARCPDRDQVQVRQQALKGCVCVLGLDGRMHARLISSQTEHFNIHRRPFSLPHHFFHLSHPRPHTHRHTHRHTRRHTHPHTPAPFVSPWTLAQTACGPPGLAPRPGTTGRDDAGCSEAAVHAPGQLALASDGC